jgi:VWFA-related protein
LSWNRRTLALLVLCALAGVGAGRPRVRPGGGAQGADQPRVPIEHVTSELVLIEAYVTDIKGRPIRGLGTDNFVLMIDGRVEPIASIEFRRHAPAPEPATAPEAIEAPPAGGSPPPDLPRRFAIFFEDDVSAAQGLTMARRAVRDFIPTRLSPTDQVALVTHRRRDVQVLSDFTTDHEALGRVLEASLNDRARVSDFSAGLREKEEQLRSILSQAGPPDAKAHQIEFLLNSFASQDAGRLHQAVAALRSLVTALAPWPGYKAIVYMGDGISENPARYYLDRLDDQLRKLNLSLDLQPSVQLNDISLELKALVDAAGAAAVTIHTVETSGLYAGEAPSSPGGASHGVASGIGAAAHRSASLQNLALNTGGLASSSNDPLKALTSAEDSSRAYYVIGYAPQGPPDGKTHSVQLRLRKIDGYLRWRRGFTRLRPPEARERAIQAAHVLPEFYADLALDLSVVPGPMEGPKRVADLVLHLAPGQILFLPEGGRPTAHLEISLVVLDETRNETLRVARTVRIALQPGLREGGEVGLDLFHRVRLPPSGQTVTAVVNDLSAGSIGATRASWPRAHAETRDIVGLSIYSLAEKSLWVDVDRDADPHGPEGGTGEYSVGPALKTSFAVGEALACGFRGRLVEGGATLRLLIRRGDRALRTLDVAPRSTASGETITTPLPIEGLAGGDYLLVVQEVGPEGGIDRAALPFRIGPRAESPLERGAAGG